VRENDDDWGNKIVKVVVEIDQDRARQLGVTSEEVTRLLNTYFSGTAVSIYREGDNAIPIVLRAGAYTSQSLEGLTSATFAKNGGLISLAQVARLKPGFDFARIRRKNQERTITVTARSTSMAAGQLLETIQPRLNEMDMSGGYHVTVGGEIQKSADTNQKSAAGFPIALAVMVLAIILQFNSIRRTLLTFISIWRRDNRSRSSARWASSAYRASSSTTPSC
jgi:multidrug efflux pump subunit AcrB